MRNHRNRCISLAWLSFPWLYSAKTPRLKKAAWPAAVSLEAPWEHPGQFCGTFLEHFCVNMPLWSRFVHVVPSISGQTWTSLRLFSSLFGLWRRSRPPFCHFFQIFNEISALSWPNFQKIGNMAKLLNVLALPYYAKGSDFCKSPQKQSKSKFQTFLLSWGLWGRSGPSCCQFPANF